jgi:hypothetical protein
MRQKNPDGEFMDRVFRSVWHSFPFILYSSFFIEQSSHQSLRKILKKRWPNCPDPMRINRLRSKYARWDITNFVFKLNDCNFRNWICKLVVHSHVF